ncbi:MAG: aldehyde dehydrogenase family protein [Tabrizicola sp.]|nr:aldehyde dehydrogenase family protein [Tabrizicola sp.]
MFDAVAGRLGLRAVQSGVYAGAWIDQPEGGQVVSINPATGQELGRVMAAGPADYDRAVASAAEVFAKWRAVPPPVRGEIVRQIGNALREAKSDLGMLVTLETGKIKSEGLGEVQEMIDMCDFAVGLSRQLYGLTIASERPNHRMIEQWHPLGPVGCITAFNFPVAVWAWNAALALVGPISRLNADITTVHKTHPGPAGPVTVTNDDIGQFMCRFAGGAMGHLSFSRVAHGRKMGYAYDISGTKGAIRFDQEDQNALWLYRATDPPAERGFRKILMGPDHPDYLPFCQGPGHGTGYQDQIIIEARDFLRAIETGQPVWPTFADGMEVMRVIDAAHRSHASGAWIDL